MAPPLSAIFVPKAPVYCIPEDQCYPMLDVSSPGHSSMDDEQEALSHSSFEEYEYFEDHLDKILEQDPFVVMPEEEVGPVAQASVRSADTRKLSEALSDQHEQDSVWYCLAILDEETGSPLRAATDEETEVLAKFLDSSTLEESSSISTCPAFHVKSEEEDGPATSATSGSVSFSPRSAESAYGASSAFTSSSPAAAARNAVRSPVLPHKSGGPCDHCLATESPQWRRGPPAKPTLCNACGTRYRRTQQLGTVVPGQRSTKGGSLPGRKRKSATRDFALQQRALKQQRGVHAEA